MRPSSRGKPLSTYRIDSTKYHGYTASVDLGFIDTTILSEFAIRADAIAFVDMSLSSYTHANGSNTAELGFIETSMESLTGANASLSFADISLTSTGTWRETMLVNLDSFTTTLSSSVSVNGQIASSLGFISSTLTAYSGAAVAFNAPDLSLSATATAHNNRVNTAIGFIDSSLSATGTYHASITAAFGFIDTYLSYNNISADAPVFTLSATMSSPIANAVAYVLNIRTGESTRYTNYAFDYIIHVGDNPVGVTSTGLYWLEGTTDNGTAINGTIKTKDTDFGSYQSKRCEYTYLNSDTSTTITPIVDGVRKKAHASAFGGRRTKMSLGNTGRYWQFEIANISKLEGAEFMPQQRQARVK